MKAKSTTRDFMNDAPNTADILLWYANISASSCGETSVSVFEEEITTDHEDTLLVSLLQLILIMYKYVPCIGKAI